MKTKYPIILVHGVMVKDFKFFRAFGRIEKILRKEGYRVYTAKIDGLGTIKNNAFELKSYIMKVLKKECVEKVNIIAHSKGGLDSKYMIENLDMENYVASFTSLCTPYKGSPIATKILSMPKFIIFWVKTWFNFVFKLFGDKNPDGLEVCKELSEVESIEKECLRINTSKVYVQSYSAKMEKVKDDFIMGIPLAFSRYFKKNEETDGLVPTDSTKIGNYQGTILEDESLSHTEVVDFLVKKKKKEKIYHFYLNLCKNLSELGF